MGHTVWPGRRWHIQALGFRLLGPQAGFGQFAFDPVEPWVLMSPPSFQSPHAPAPRLEGPGCTSQAKESGKDHKEGPKVMSSRAGFSFRMQ